MTVLQYNRRSSVAAQSSPSSSASTNDLSKRQVAQGSVLQLTRSFLMGQLTYTTPITIEGQTMVVQVDTGSSDLWLASDKCNTPSCVEKEGYEVNLFSDNTGLETGDSTTIDYLAGSATGPIVKSNITLGATTIPMQAFMTADRVQNEPLGAMQASGVLGLGLPLDSRIQAQLSDTDTQANNSITNVGLTGSFLPGLWSVAPQGQRFFGLGLQRLPSDGGNGNSTVTFGGYDPSYVSAEQQKNIVWDPVVPNSDDNLTDKWKVSMSELSINVNGTDLPIPLSKTGALGAPTAILDSGAPLNYANANFLNALYGAMNVGPSADSLKEFYVDCKYHINMTLTVNGAKIPIHPLDSSLKFSNQAGMNSNDGCIGSFQSFSDSVDLDQLGANIVLGAPFLRSVYSLYSCDPNPRNTTQTAWCSNPWIGLYPLYGQQTALDTANSDFQKVRVMGQQLGDNSAVSGAATKKSGGFSSGAQIAVGVICGLLGILIVMAGLLLWLKRKRSRMDPSILEASSHEEEEKNVVTGAASVDWNKLSENERQKARELAKLHGHFVDDSDPDGGRTSPLGTARPEGDWDISSKGYWEARAIKNDYLRRERDRDSSAAARSLSTTMRGSDVIEPMPYSDSEAHEMVPTMNREQAPAAATDSPMDTPLHQSPPLSPYRDLPGSPNRNYI